jgi:hypothetical protein
MSTSYGLAPFRLRWTDELGERSPSPRPSPTGRGWTLARLLRIASPSPFTLQRLARRPQQAAAPFIRTDEVAERSASPLPSPPGRGRMARRSVANPTALGRAGVAAFHREAQGASGSDVRPKNDAGCQFPLPAGEGQGEGERDAANQNGRTSFAGSARPTPRLKVDCHVGIKACREWKRARSQASPIPDCSGVETNSPHPCPLPQAEGEHNAGS